MTALAEGAAGTYGGAAGKTAGTAGRAIPGKGGSGPSTPQKPNRSPSGGGEKTSTSTGAPNAPNKPSHPTFAPGPHSGRSIPARSSAQEFTDNERAAVDAIGSKTGCHTCGTKNPGTKTGHFVPDHQPPTRLNADNRPQRLYPQCVHCSREQGLPIARGLRENK